MEKRGMDKRGTESFIRKENTGGTSSFASRVRVKSTAQGTSLSDRSAHLPNIHMSWPVSRFKHMSRVCTSFTLAAEAQQDFFRKFISDCPTHCSIELLRDHLEGKGCSRHRLKEARSGNNSWLVIPYHAAWQAAGLSRTLLQITSGFDRHALLRDFGPKLSWS